MFTAVPPTSVNTGSGGFRRRKYKVVDTLNLKTKISWSVRARNALQHMEKLNTLVQFGQVVGMLVIIL